MKVSMLSTLPPIKGLSPYTLGLVKELSKEIEIDFYGFKSIYPEFLYPGGTKTNEKTPNIENVNIKNNLTWYNPFSWMKVGFLIKTDVLHVQWWSWFLSPVYLTILSIAKLRKKKIVMTIHNVKPHEKSFIKNLLNSSVIGFADEYIVHSESNKREFEKFSKGKKVWVIPIGLEINKEISKVKARNSLNLPKDSIILLFFGNVRDYKGLDILVKAFEQINIKNKILLIAGQIWEENLKELVNDKENIIYSGGFIPKEKIPDYFSASDVVVYPYKYFDASSAAATDALSYGKPIVVTNVGGLPDIVKDKKTIANPNDINSLKESILYAIKNKKKLEADSKEMQKLFLWENIAEKTRGVYNGKDI